MFYDDCPVKLTLSLISNKWKVLIIYELLNGKKRYGELNKALKGISKKVLTENLKALEKTSLINKEVFNENIPKVEYSLTSLGLSLYPILNSMCKWGEEYKKINSK